MSRASCLLLGVCLLTPALSMAAAPVPAPVQAPDTPDLELLEFLGEWSGEGEEWLKQQKLEQEKAVAAPKAEVKKDE